MEAAMDFGWEAKAFWIILVVVLIGSIWYAKRHKEPPPSV
jgi:hypothetical protein